MLFHRLVVLILTWFKYVLKYMRMIGLQTEVSLEKNVV